MSQRKMLFLLGALMIAVGGLLVGCEGNDVPDQGTGPEGMQTATCEGCHTNQEMLIATALPDEPPEDTGEG